MQKAAPGVLRNWRGTFTADVRVERKADGHGGVIGAGRHYKPVTQLMSSRAGCENLNCLLQPPSPLRQSRSPRRSSRDRCGEDRLSELNLRRLDRRLLEDR
jgi:hypothetical protein